MRAGRAALAGFTAGVWWGAAARVWMRLVATQPEFSWTGTLFIVGLSGLLGAGVGVSWAARGATGRRRLLRAVALPGLLLFAGPGLPLLPGFLAGALLWRRPVVLRLLGVVGLIGPAVVLWWVERFDETTFLSAPPRQQAALLIGMPLLSLALAAGGHLVLGPAPDSSLEAPAGPA
jgi:hypothetical protein